MFSVQSSANRECPKGHHNCMNSINADMVFNEIEKYMNKEN